MTSLARLPGAIFRFIKESAALDLPRLRTLAGLFLFRLVPDLYLLKALGGACLRAAGVRLYAGDVYVRGPLRVDFGRNLTLGAGTFVNIGCYFQNYAPVSVGRRCQIGPYCVFATTNHREGGDESLPIRLGDGVWLGAGVKVMPGAVIGDGIAVAAGAVVSGELSGGSLWGGIPARRLR